MTTEKRSGNRNESVATDRAGDSNRDRPVAPDEAETLFHAVEGAVFLIDVERTGRDLEFTFRRVNPAYEAATGLTDASVTGKSLQNVFELRPDGETLRRYRECVEGGEPVDVSATRSLPVGQRTVETTLHPADSSGPVRRIVGIVRDISERETPERELERNRDLLTKAEDLAAVGGWELDLRTNDLRWTDGTRAIFEVDDDYEPTLPDAIEFYRPADRPRIRAFVEACRHDEESYDGVLEIVTAEGNDRWVRTVGKPVTEGGTVVALRGAVQDVTARKERERELQLFRKAVEQAGHGIIITDRSGTIEYVNPAYERDTGYSRTEAVGLNPRIVKSGKHDEAFYEDLWDTIGSGEIWESELVNRRKSGELYHVDQTIAPITDDAGEITHFVAIETDITAQRLRRQRLGVLNRILRHNIRNAMNVIKGNATRLRTASAAAERHTAVTAIEEQAADLLKISENAAAVRDLFQRERDADATCDVGAMVSRLAADFDEQYPDAAITVTAPDSVPVQADDRLEMAIREAIHNAVSHNDRPVPDVTVGVTPPEATDSGDWVDIVIADNGPGIPAEERPMIELGHETPLVHGTGLELWLIYWVTKNVGGELRISENEPRGTIVTLRVPPAT
ncbi:signal-transducing histidine kinase/response regulator [Natrinema pellirubrum DSM 15624]|uniref:PAS domain S-box n=1 Tax=Natrinema pellirubrum (strain DSM 15624 / CIP 106293 / JCM 10476 / NCIMB 786 / 157) TaxID=797303 RepID=L0JNN1_NATP1|nr:PAS domain-containing sensor histidine kinase [Natrinema pellirubrum]AGB33145.1 PAS domain S-box [Natrinema pellirubrum DSM 15624]ELY71809.1 signal-transducing histidine kinase/response regulator [Natrinema pellirubrum DSM 15624]